MKLNRLFASMLILAATATSSFAAGAVSLNWNTCVGPIDIAVAGGGPIDGYASVFGQSQTSQAYQIRVFAGSSGGGLADAWRFDPSGCEGTTLYSLNSFPQSAISKACPSFQGAVAAVHIPDFSYDITTGKALITFANAYPNADANGINQGNPGAVTPTVHYCLVDYHFDLTFATVAPTDPGNTCGGVGKPVCLAIAPLGATAGPSWVDLAGNEVPWAVAGGFLTTNDPTDAQHCPGIVPTQSKTWGQVKDQYR
jgi:hypothetical protein